MAKCFLRAFVIVSLTFYSSMRQSYDTGCASSSDAQFHRTLLGLSLRQFTNKLMLVIIGDVTAFLLTVSMVSEVRGPAKPNWLSSFMIWLAIWIVH